MGTTYNVTVVSDEGFNPADLTRLQQTIETELEGVNQRMSTYLEDSELSQFNSSREILPFEVSSETAEVMAEALAIGNLTHGAFDVTVGPLVDAYGFGAGGSTTASEVPSEEEVAALRESVGYRKIAVDLDAGTLSKANPELAADLSGIAKGYAVDRVAEALLAAGISDFLVEVGGEVRTSGSNARGAVWRLGIERPDSTHGVVERVVPLDGLAMATSGDYRNYREVGGRRYSHLIDPRTGRSIGHRLASVSVVTERCARADALATALMVLGEQEGMQLVESEGLAVLFLIRGGENGFTEIRSSAFDRLVASDSASSP